MEEREGAVGACDAIRARVTRQPLRTWRVAICRRALAGGLNGVIAHDGPREHRLVRLTG
jgi:hypothetical protein